MKDDIEKWITNASDELVQRNGSSTNFPLMDFPSRLTLTSSPGWDFVETRANPIFFSRRLDQTLLVKSPILFPSNMMSFQTKPGRMGSSSSMINPS